MIGQLLYTVTNFLLEGVLSSFRHQASRHQHPFFQQNQTLTSENTEDPMKKMPISAIERTSITKLSFFIFIICIFISLKNQNADTKRRFTSTSSMAAINYFSSTDTSFISPDAFSSDSLFLSDENDMSRAVDPPPRSLEYDFYRDSCPGAEQKIRSVVTELYRLNSSVAPALLRLAFHDCFIQYWFNWVGM